MKYACTLVVLVAMTIGGAARAQAPGDTPPTNQQKVERVKQRILALRAARLTSELNLDEKQAAKLFPVLSKYDDTFAKLLKEAVELRKQAQAAAEKNDDAALNDIIDKLVANQRQRWDTQEARFKDVRKVLTPEQAARLLVVLPQIDRQISNQLRKALGRPGRGSDYVGKPGGRGHRRAGANAGGGDSDDDDLDDNDDGPIQ